MKPERRAGRRRSAARCGRWGLLGHHDRDAQTVRHVDHIEHIVSVAGIDHVGLGSDFVREVMVDVTPPCCESPDD
ncbi:membrane dipeptidase [Streptomyces lydicus]|uniref:membrane dipeptidase n=1 Tax=Streptomyces lydicus TaxID=47763 RepID=UPI0037977AE4